MEKKPRDRLEIYESEQGVRSVCDMTVEACAGRMELLSIIFIYTHNKDSAAGSCPYWRKAHIPAPRKKKKGGHLLFVQTDESSVLRQNTVTN